VAATLGSTATSLHYVVDGDGTLYDGTLGLTPIHGSVMKRAFEVTTTNNLMHMLNSDNTAMEQLVDMDSNVRFLARRMDGMVAHTLTPEDELVAGQAELVRGVWLAEMLVILSQRAKLLNVQIESTWFLWNNQVVKLIILQQIYLHLNCFLRSSRTTIKRQQG
jgi:hypothetical protein